MRTHLTISIACLCLALTATNTQAEFVYVTSTVSNCVNVVDCPGNLNVDVNINGNPVYNESGIGFFTTAIALAPGKPPTTGARAFSFAFTNSTPDSGITISPTLSVTGGVYKLYHVFSSAAGNVNTNVLLSVTNVDGCTLSFTNGINKFQSSFGASSAGMNVWQFIGYVTA